MVLHWWPWPSINYRKIVPSVRKKCLKNHVISPSGHPLMSNKWQILIVQWFHYPLEKKFPVFLAYCSLHICSSGSTLWSSVYGAPSIHFGWYCYFQAIFVKNWQTKPPFFFLKSWSRPFFQNIQITFILPRKKTRLSSGAFIKHDKESL